MIRPVSSLLFGLGLCVASGCASVGTGRGLNLADRTPWNRTDRVQSRTAREAKDRGTDAEIESIRSARVTAESTEIPSKSSSFSGHSSKFPHSTTALHSDGQSATRDEPADDGPDDFVRLARAEDDSTQMQGTNRLEPELQQLDRDVGDNPIQLQGLQAIEPTASNDAGIKNSGSSDNGSVNSASLSDESSSGGQSAVIPTSAQDASFGQTTPFTMSPSAQVQLVNVPPASWQADLERLIVRTEQQLATMTPGIDAKARAEYRRQQVHLRLLYLIARHPEQALTAIPSPDPADQEYWQQIVWAITNSLDADEQLSVRERAAQSIPPVNTALRRLREQADLTIRNSAFCEEISYFGNYKRFPREEFVPGQPVLLYAELENFLSEPTATTGEYRTLLRSLIEIVGADGQIRWKKSFAATEDLCRNPRRDYFHNYQFTIPERLPLGPHTLKLTVVDELSGKQATSAIRFMVK